jgi:hypothetical protein
MTEMLTWVEVAELGWVGVLTVLDAGRGRREGVSLISMLRRGISVLPTDGITKVH